jgi:hypothetical protein
MVAGEGLMDAVIAMVAGKGLMDAVIVMVAGNVTACM